MNDPTPTTAQEAVARIIYEGDWQATWAEASREIADAIIAYLTSPEAVERAAAILAQATGEPRAGRFEKTMASAVILAALGEVC